ncbi:MAG: hypothetical protein GZ088_15595 [Acidipila sp.]|nr:hypothetical protein [Acidipila sp.]
MRKYATLTGCVVTLAGALLAGLPLRAQNSVTADTTRVTVTVTSRDQGVPAASLRKEDVIVRVDNSRRPVVDWAGAAEGGVGMDLAILVDDSLDTRLGGQFKDLHEFLRALPPTTRVGVAYSSHGSARFRQELSADHELAAKALRLPSGATNDVSAIYLALADMLKNWPAGTNRRAVLLISDGIDLFRGVSDSEPGQNIDLQAAIDLAQRNGITVFTLFASGAAPYRNNFYLVGNGQSGLLRLAAETGGEAYFQGSQTPIAFRPFLQKAAQRFDRQYVLTFRAHTGEKTGFARLQVTTEVPRVQIAAPARVYVPPNQ